MEVIESFLEKAWGDSVENPASQDVKVAILETKKMDDEHGAFWVGVFGENDEEIVLEVDNNLRTTLLLNPESNEAISKFAESWDQVIEHFENLLNGDIERINKWITTP